ncbi:MAG: DUF1566 domain-containing protein [Mucinivorans sp.]
MKIKVIIFSFLILVTLPRLAYAQEVTSSAAGFIIDCSSMPAALTTSVPKARTTSGTDAAKSAAGLGDLASKESDAKIYNKIDVMEFDGSVDGSFNTPASWAAAVGYCNNHNYRGFTGCWRLPTYREMLLICTMLPKSIQFNNLTPFSEWYWTATDTSATTACVVNFSDPVSAQTDRPKTDKLKYRCVRDVK